MTKHIPFTICWLWQLSAFPAPRLLWCSQLVRCHRRRAPAGTARPCEWHKNPAARCWLLGVEPFFFLPNVVWALILYATSNILGNPSPSAAALFDNPPPPPCWCISTGKHPGREAALFLPSYIRPKFTSLTCKIDPSDVPTEERPGLEQVYDGCSPLSLKRVKESILNSFDSSSFFYF